MSLEAGRRLHYEQVITAARRQAVRHEWSLVDRLVAHLGIEATRREYRLAGGSTLWSDLWIEEGRTLVEAKGQCWPWRRPRGDRPALRLCPQGAGAGGEGPAPAGAAGRRPGGGPGHCRHRARLARARWLVRGRGRPRDVAPLDVSRDAFAQASAMASQPRMALKQFTAPDPGGSGGLAQQFSRFRQGIDRPRLQGPVVGQVDGRRLWLDPSESLNVGADHLGVGGTLNTPTHPVRRRQPARREFPHRFHVDLLPATHGRRQRSAPQPRRQ